MVFLSRLAHDRRTYVAGGRLVLVLLLWWFVGASKSFKDCEEQYKSEHHYIAPHGRYTMVIRAEKRFALHTACLGVFTDTNRDDLTLLATVVVAAFTGTLWWSTEKLVRADVARRTDTERSLQAAEDSARAALKLASRERPYLFAEVAPTIEAEWVGGLGGMTPYIPFSITNHGRSPARIINAFVEMTQSDFDVGFATLNTQLLVTLGFKEKKEGRHYISIDSVVKQYVGEFERSTQSVDEEIIFKPVWSRDCETYFIVNLTYEDVDGTAYREESVWVWLHSEQVWFRKSPSIAEKG